MLLLSGHVYRHNELGRSQKPAMHRKRNAQKLNALWGARGVWDSHMAVWQTEDDGKIKGMKDPKSFKQKTSAYQIPTRLQSPLATPYPAVKRNVAYNTACEARS